MNSEFQSWHPVADPLPCWPGVDLRPVYALFLLDKVLVGYFFAEYFGSILTDDGRCTREIKSMIAMAKAAFNKKKTLFTSKLDLNLRKKLVKCYIWSMAFYGVETWKLRAADQKYL